MLKAAVVPVLLALMGVALGNSIWDNIWNRFTQAKSTYKCSSNEFKCANQDTCIPQEWQCDGYDDCGDLSDEMYLRNCPQVSQEKPEEPQEQKPNPDSQNMCDHQQFWCANYKWCIDREFVCDGDNDCGDWSDESSDKCKKPQTNPWTNLWTENSKSCGANEFLCEFSQKCISQKKVCDGNDDCGDYSDEHYQFDCQEQKEAHQTVRKGGNGGLCGSSRFSCKSIKKCVALGNKCDGKDDCGDGSDEKDCGPFEPNPDVRVNTTGQEELKKTEFPEQRVLNLTSKHPNQKLTTLCAADHFRCKDKKKCIPLKAVCNGTAECGDMSDEDNCEKIDMPGQRRTDVPRGGSLCGDISFSCRSIKKCVPMAAKCDGKNDCRDGSDEENCPTQ